MFNVRHSEKDKLKGGLSVKRQAGYRKLGSGERETLHYVFAGAWWVCLQGIFCCREQGNSLGGRQD